MNTFETAAVISLIDHLTGPLARMGANVSAANSHFSSLASKMADAGKTMTYSMTVPLVAAATSMTKHGLEFSKAENTLLGVLENRALTMKGLTQTSKEYAEHGLEAIRKAGEAAYESTNGMSNILEFQKSAMAGVKAGLDIEAAAAVAQAAVNLALAGRMDEHTATEQLISLGNSFGIVSKNADGTTKAIKDVLPQYEKLSDLLATMSTNSNMTSTQAADSLKLPLPIAHTMGMDPSILGAMSASMAEKGFKGAEAGTAMREFLMALAAPKYSAGPTLAAAGINLSDFQKFRDGGAGMNAASFVTDMTRRGMKISNADAERVFADAERRGEEAAKTGEYFNKLEDIKTNLIGVLRRAGTKTSPVSPLTADKMVNTWANMRVEGMDVLSFILKSRDAHGGTGLTPGELRNVFQGKQVPRLQSFMTPAHHGTFDPFNFEMERMYGPDWRKELEDARNNPDKAAVPKYLGNAKRMAEEHSRGLEGAYKRIHNSFTTLEHRLNKIGVFNNIAEMMNSMSRGLDNLSKDPGRLNQLVTLTKALMVLGPALMISGRVMQLAKALSVLGMGMMGMQAAQATAAAGAAGTTAKAIQALGGASVVAAASGFALAVAGIVGAVALLDQMTRAEAIKKGIVHGGTPDPLANPNFIDEFTTNGGVSDPEETAARKRRKHWWQWWNDPESPNWDNDIPYGTAYMSGMSGAPTPPQRPGYMSGVPMPPPRPTNLQSNGSGNDDLRTLIDNMPKEVKGEVTGNVDMVSKVDVVLTGLDVAMGTAITRALVPLKGKLGNTMAGSNATGKEIIKP